MKSGKQRRAELQVKRDARRKQAATEQAAVERRRRERLLAAKEREGVAVNPDNLVPYNSYGQPPFVERGYYVDQPFTCQGCGVEQIWTATQQKWWYEVAKGSVYSIAALCRNCRRLERERKAKAQSPRVKDVTRKTPGG